MTTTTLNSVAVTSADLLRAIASDTGWVTKADLAVAAGRGPKNISRDLGIVVDAGLVAVDAELPPREGITLTDEGRAQLAAIARAEHGGERRKSRGRAPLAAFIPNPANRRVTDHSVQVMADTIEAVGDVLERIKATPADATGVRMLLDGETRWRAVGLLTEQGRLPEALAEGIPFEEREATDAEQILIRIVTASARTDLTPLDDARQLLALQEATNWSAREIAKKTGRSPADSDTGVRDVQVKIKVAREATPFFLKQYELDGSWDRLRDSVTQPKPRLPPEQELSQALATHGAAALGEAAPDQPPPPAGDSDPAAAPPPAAEEWVLDAPWKEELQLALNVKHDRLAIRLFSHPEGRWFASLDTALYNHGGGMGESYTAGRHNPAHGSRLEALKAARKRALERHPDMPAAFRDWLDQQLGPFYVNGVDRLNASNAGEARRTLGWAPRQSNSGGGKGKPPAAGALKAEIQKIEAAPPPPELTASAIDRLHEIADWIDDNPSGNGEGFETLGLGRPLNADEDLLVAAGHLLATGEGADVAVYLTGSGTRFVRQHPTAHEAEERERIRLAAETAKADPAPAEATDNAAIDALAERMRQRAARHRERGGGRWTVFPERELARQLLDAVGNGQIERAAVIIAWLNDRQGGVSEKSQAVQDAGGSWLISKQLIGAFHALADAARHAADPETPPHLVQMKATDALTRAGPHLRPIAPMADEVTT